MPIPISEFETSLVAILEDLRIMVEIESPTTVKAGVDRLGEWVASRLENIGLRIDRRPQDSVGDHWIGEIGSGDGGILLLHHLDTVYPGGTLEAMPWRIEGDRALGPGVLDMKGGIAVTLAALSRLRDQGVSPRRPIRCLFSSDEETGSRTSRPLIEDLARRAEVVLCLEPALPGGGLKTSRKGTGLFLVEAFGRAAHAGNNPEAGINAIDEMARQIPAIHGLASPSDETTVSVGVIQGGTRTNVIPASCLVKIDVRVTKESEQARVEAGLKRLRPGLAGARIEVRGGWNRPPMPRTPAIGAAFDHACAIAATLGIQLAEGAAGGGSDANFVAALGGEVLDGLGPVGDGAHSTGEFIEVASLAPRAALLAAILTDW